MSKPENQQRVMVITGTRKGIGRYLAEYYLGKGYRVYGCSRGEADDLGPDYTHFCLDIGDEAAVTSLFASVRRQSKRLDVLLNNAGIASMNHALLTPLSTVQKIFSTNVMGTFLFCREGAKLMRKSPAPRIVNFTTVATPLKLEGEAIYAASKAAVNTLTQILAREFAQWGITVNAVGPTPIPTDLIRGVPSEKLESLLARQAIRRYGTNADVSNVVDFFIRPESDFVTGQILYLGGV